MKLINILRHVTRGTLLTRIKEARKHRLFREYENFQNSDRKYIDKKLSSNTTIRLYKKANLSKELYCYGFEEAEILFLRRYLRAGDVALDVGANIGLMTLIVSEQVKSAGAVHSLEPAPETFGWLKENTEINSISNVRLYNMALSDREGKIDFYVSQEGLDAFNSVIKPAKGDNYQVKSVDTTTLDKFVSALPSKVTFIKMDVEGFELSVLEGGRNILSADDAPELLVEFTESNLKSAGHSTLELYDKISGLGYRLYSFDASSHRLVAEPRGQDYSRYKNLLATKRPAFVEARLQSK